MSEAASRSAGPVRPSDPADRVERADPLPAEVWRRLHALVPADGWASADPYLLRHAAEHAAEAGQLEPLLREVEFVVHAEPDGLMRAMNNDHTARATGVAAAYAASFPLHRAWTAEQRRLALEVDSTRLELSGFAARLTRPDGWRVHWSTVGALTRGAERTLVAHDGPVNAAAQVSVEGRPLTLTGGLDGSLRLWDLDAGRLVRDIPDPFGGVTACVAAVVDGVPHVLVAGADGGARLFDVAQGAVVHDFHQPSTIRLVVIATCAVDGRQHGLVGGGDGVLRQWDLSTGTLVQELPHNSEPLTAVAVMVIDGVPHALTACADYFLRLWDLTTGEIVRSMRASPGAARHLQVTYLDGVPHAVSAGGDPFGRLWNLATGIEVRTFETHFRHMEAVATAAGDDGRPLLAVGGRDGSVTVLDPATAQVEHRFAGHTMPVTVLGGVRVGSRNHVLTGAQDGVLRLWDLALVNHPTTRPTAHTTRVGRIEVFPPGKHPHVASMDDGGTLNIWNVRRGRLVRTLADFAGEFLGLAHYYNRTYALLAVRDRLTLRNIRADVTYQPLRGSDFGRLTAAAMPDNGAFVMGVHEDGHIVTWNPRRGVTLRWFDTAVCGRFGGYPVTPVALSLDADPFALIAETDGLKLWHGRNREIVHRLGHAGHVRLISALAYGGSPHAVTASTDGHVRVWDLASGHEVRRAPAADVEQLIPVTVEGRPCVLVNSSDRWIRLWDLDTDRWTTQLRPARGLGQPVDVDSYGHLVAAIGHDLAVFRPPPALGRVARMPQPTTWGER